MKFKIFKNRFDAIEPYIKGKMVLDIGCVDARPNGQKKYISTGLHLFLKEHASELLGIDIDKSGIKQMKEDGYNVMAADTEKMNLGRQFDCIVAGEIIEHLSNPGLFLENIRNHLIADGILIITTSNAFGINNFFRILKKNRIKVHAEHTCWYDPTTLTQLLRRYSFEAEKIFFANKSKWYLKKYFHKLRYQIPKFITYFRTYFSGVIIVIARKRNYESERLMPPSEIIMNFLPNINSIIDKGNSFSLLKNDSSTTVGIIRGEDFNLLSNLWVKRFNYKGFSDFLLKLIFGSRARRLWDINQRLYKKSLPVAKPVIYIEPSFKQKDSFYLASFIDNSDNLGNIYKKGLFHKCETLAVKLAKTIAEWHSAGAVHGDLKWSNILMQKCDKEYRFFLVDLDQSKLYPAPSIKGIKKDLTRFYRYGLELGAEEWVDSEFFPKYISIIPDKIRSKIDLDYIKNKAYKDWHKKGQRSLRPV